MGNFAENLNLGNRVRPPWGMPSLQQDTHPVPVVHIRSPVSSNLIMNGTLAHILEVTKVLLLPLVPKGGGA